MNYISGDNLIAFISHDNKVFTKLYSWYVDYTEIVIDFIPQYIYKTWDNFGLILSDSNILYFFKNSYLLDIKINLGYQIIKVFSMYTHFLVLDSNNTLSIYCDIEKLNAYKAENWEIIESISANDLPNYSNALLILNMIKTTELGTIQLLESRGNIYKFYICYPLIILVFVDSSYLICRAWDSPSAFYYLDTYIKAIESKFLNIYKESNLKSIKEILVLDASIFILYENSILEIRLRDAEFYTLHVNVLDIKVSLCFLVVLFKDTTVKIYEISDDSKIYLMENNILVDELSYKYLNGIVGIHVSTSGFVFIDSEGTMYQIDFYYNIQKTNGKYKIKMDTGTYI